MTGSTWWNVVDNCGAPGEPSISGIFTRDMQPKISYYAMDDLINREWKTNLSVKSNNQTTANGRTSSSVAFRGFKGRYKLCWKGADGREKSKIVEVK